MDPPGAHVPPDTLVVFEDEGCLRFLARGFRHCFVARRGRQGWVLMDGRMGVPELEAIAPPEYDLAAAYRAMGHRVIATRRRRARMLWPFMAATCVGAAKRLLGIHAWWVITPRQLWRYLENER